MIETKLIPFEEFQRIQGASIPKYERLALLSDMCRANALSTVKRAGSGHLGSSFSSLDIVTMLYYSEMNVGEVGNVHPDRDIYLSSKGHDAPGHYAVLFSLGILSRDMLIKLRRFGGTHGHPDVSIPGIEANSGSLGMGISKAKGIAWAKRLRGHRGRVFVMTGDGELQEGQIYEALQTAAHQGINNLHVIVDHNKVQSDKLVSEISDLGDLEAKFHSFGWHVSRCNGHDFRELDSVFAEWRERKEKPKILIADTIKGYGVSFMEHPAALKAANGLYTWHAGAPDDPSFHDAYQEIILRTESRLADLGLPKLQLEEIPPEKKELSGVSREYVADAFGEILVEIAGSRDDIVVLDADLAGDCRLRAFEHKYPERFIENGIAEQDMVSTAGGLALQGLLPVVNSFAAFLAARANEQIYTNSSEKSKIIYVCHYGGLIPAGPGGSHQSLRDISLLGALPNCCMIQPCNAAETRMTVEYCVHQAVENCMIRLVIGPSPREIFLPPGYFMVPGQGVALCEGNDAIAFAYGPVMLNEMLVAGELLKKQDFGLKVVNMPWLNRTDRHWLTEIVRPYRVIYVLEDHFHIGGLGDFLLNVLMDEGLLGTRRLKKFAVEGYPACGTPVEVLRYHGLDGRSLSKKILENQE